MKFVYILEDDARFQREIVDAIQNIDPKIQIRIFAKLQEFVIWLSGIGKTEGASLATGGVAPAGIEPEPITEEQHQLVALVAKVEYLGIKQIPLLKKTREQFIKLKICTAEDPTAFVLTAFEDPEFKIQDLRDRILNNVIYKPFDRLILTQHLTFAIDGRHPPSKYTISNQKTTALVEMLKDVKIEAINEVGFVTRSDRNLEKIGLVSKYYGNIFASGLKGSLMAAVMQSKADPSASNQFICFFSFFGMSPEQISTIRKKVRTTASNFNFETHEVRKNLSRKERKFGAVIIDEVELSARELMASIKRRFAEVDVVHYKNLTDFLVEIDPKLVEKSDVTPPKALPADKEIKFIFDPNGHHIIEIVKPTKDALQIFGSREIDIKNQQWWGLALGELGLQEWKDWTIKPHDHVVVIKNQQNKFYISPKSFSRDKDNRQITVTFAELSADQKNQYIIKKSKIPKIIDALFVSHAFLKPTDNERWLKIKESFKSRAQQASDFNTTLFVLASKDFTDSEMRQFGTFVSDIFYRPFDRAYFAMKLKFFFPELSTLEEPIQFHSIVCTDDISTANPVQISEISEAGLVMQYYRNMSLGAFRGFVLWMPYEIGAPKLIGTCNFTEESGQKGIFNNHFVFFGMTDHFLKTIRIWIRDNYILSKEQGS